LVVISLAALRNTATPDTPTKVMAGSRVDFSTRLSPARASRGAERPLLLPASTTSSIAAPTSVASAAKAQPKATAKPKVTVKATTTTAKPQPKPQPKSQSKAKPPAATTTTKPPASKSGASSPPSSAKPMPTGGSTSNGSEEGKASYYDAKYHQDDPWVCAHKTLPMGTILTVTDLGNGKTIKCRVGDRGPYVEGRVVDLSRYAFSQLASTSSGVISVKISW
ncbi:MAG: rare lipoprotein, partial [Actinomycetota bacterium]